MTEQEFETLNELLNKQRNIKITVGAIGGVILILYFFTFAMLIDKAPFAFVIVEAITGTAIFISFFMLNKISFSLLKILVKGSEKKKLLERVNPADVDKKPETLKKELIG
ncbi:MAG: hypothetical protein OEX00_06840 [Gammaproteobacteria bacterium]|nr:hypothetical protein [Gammaproteobacteria bacterium]MDH5694149.1 hypothetical protein [Gammaproteobacteria bacterium]